jgi:hypothetical protein
MIIKILPLVVILSAIFLMPSTADAQFSESWKDWYGHVAMGYSWW